VLAYVGLIHNLKDLKDGLDEFLLPNLWIENLEELAGPLQQTFTLRQVVLHRSPVHQVEQRAHLPRGLLRFPACLEGAEGSTRACGLNRALWNL